MSDYFLNVGTKASINSSEVFSNEGSKPELLLPYYSNRPRPIETNLLAVDSMFQEWCDTLFNNYNIVVHGRLSKFRLLESFKARYLDSGKIPDFRCPTEDSSFLNVITVRMHGFTPITLEKFNHAVFGIVDGHKFTDDDQIKFLEGARESQTHYVFLLHSFESLYLESKPICNIIFQLYEREPEYIHILMTCDHFNSGKMLSQLKFRLQLIFFTVPYGESFFYERTQAVSIMDECDANDIANPTNKLFEGQLDLQSLKDVYQAIQYSCQKILLYIITHYLDQVNRIQENKEEAIALKSKSRRQQQEQNTDLEFNHLLHYCMTKFLVRRSNILHNHLGELKDHRLIQVDETGNKIQCLISISTCRKFMEFVKDL